jgi:hypothetical protein
MKMRAGSAPRRCHRGALGLWLTLAAVPATAQVGPLTYQNLFFNQASNAHSGNYLAADAGLVYTDNATFTGNGSGDTLGEVGLVGNATQESLRFDYRLVSDLAAVKYFGGNYPVEPTGYFDGMADLKIVPGLFTWIGRETYSQLELNALAPATPDNLENLNYITTGPRFTLQPTLRTTVRLELLYSYVDSHSSSPAYVNIDNHRYGGTLRIERAFSSAASLYLKGSYEKVDFTDTAINNNFTLAESAAGYRLEGARTRLDVSAGYTQLRQLDVPIAVQSVIGTVERSQTETYNVPNWSFDLSRLITPSQRVSLRAFQRVVDFATGFQVGFDQAVPTIALGQIALGAPFTLRTFGVDWRWQASRTTLDVALLDSSAYYKLTQANERDLVTPPQNRDVKAATALLARQLSPVLNWDIGMYFQHQDLTAVGGGPSTGAESGAANLTTELTDLRWQAGRRVTLRFFYAHSQSVGAHDNQVGAIASYALLEAGQLGGIQLEQAEPAPVLSPVAPTSTLPQP